MAYEKRIQGIINQVISDIKKISEDRNYHFSLAQDMETGKLPIYSVLDKYPEVTSLGYMQSLSPEARQEIIDSPELDEKDWETFRQYTALLEKKGITQQLVHAYPVLFPDSLLRRTHFCFLSFSREEKKFFLKSEFKGETIQKEMDLEALEKIGREYLELLEKQDRHYNKTGKAISCQEEFKRQGKLLFKLFLSDEWIADGLKRIYVDTPVDMDASPHRPIFEALPFEILYSDRYHFLSINQRIPVIRSYAHAPASRISAVDFPFKLLVIISNPPGLDRSQKINVEREKRIFYKTLDPLVYEGKLEIDVIDIATHANITARLRKQRFDAVHFLGHGFENGILLESEDEGQETISCEKFASLFTGASIKLFFLTSCLTDSNTPANQYSSAVRELRKIGIPVVVGMSHPLTYKAAEILVQEFYITLFQSPDHSLTDAYTLSLNKIYLDPHPLVSANAFIPVIYLPVDFDDFQWPKAEDAQALLYHKFEFLGSLKNHTTGCYGREDLLRRAKKALQNPNYRILIVKGIGGIGKSAFIYRLIRDLYSNYSGFFVKEFRTETVDKGYDIHRFFHEFNEFLIRQGDDSLQQVLSRGAGNYSVPDIIKMIAGAMERLHMLLVLENLEQLLERGEDGKFRFKDSDFQDLVEAVINAISGIRLIVGTCDGFQCPAFENTPALKCEILLSTIDSVESTVDIAKEADPDMPGEKMEALVRHSGGYPLFIQLMANPTVSIDEIEDPDFESLTRAVGGEKIQKVFQYIEKNLQEPERKALYSLSFTFLPFDRGLIEKFLPLEQVDSLLRLPFFQKETSVSLYLIPGVITRYFIKTYETRYHNRDIKKIHQVTADYYSQVLKDGITSKPFSQAQRKFLLIYGSHIQDRLINDVIYHYLEALDYKKVRAVTLRFFEHLLDTGSALFLEHVLTMLKKRMKNPGNEVDFFLARVSAELYKFDHSKELYLSLLDRVDSQKDKAGVFYHLGRLYDNKQDFAEAFQWYQKSAAVFEETGDRKGLAETYNALGIMYYKRSDYAESIRWCQRSAKIKEEIGDRKGMAGTYHQLGITYNALHDYASAIRWYQKSAAISEKISYQKGMADTYNQLGITYNNQTDYAAALQWYQKSAAICEKIGDRKGLALTYLNLGITYGQLRNYEEALRWYQKSSAICEEIGHRECLATIYNNLGGMYNQSQDYNAALKWYQTSAFIFEEIGNKKGLAHTYHQLGMTYEHKKEYSTALEWYDKSFVLAKEIKDFPNVIFAIAQKSLMYFNMGNYPEAFINILSAITFAEKDAPHLLKQVQSQLKYFYNTLGEEKARKILNAL